MDMTPRLNKKERRELARQIAEQGGSQTPEQAAAMTEEEAQSYFEPPAPAPVVAKPVTPTAAKYRGVGLIPGFPSKVMAFQDETLRANAEWKLTDGQLALLWNQEFPGAIHFSEKTVRVVRREFNDHKRPTSKADDPLSLQYNEGEGRPQARRVRAHVA